MTKWMDLNYLLNIAGNRTVPIEIGSHYVDENWSQKLMTLQDFIKNHFLSDCPDKRGYLAQHNLFDQVGHICFYNNDNIHFEVIYSLYVF